MNSIKPVSISTGAQGWSEYYTKDSFHYPTISRREEMHNRHVLFLNSIIKRLEQIHATRLIEVGIGTGHMYSYILKQKPRVDIVAIDIDQYFLKTSLKLDKELGLHNKHNIKRILTDTRNIEGVSSEESKTTVVFHQGLLEHYNNKEIKNILDQQNNIGKTIYISVPSRYFNFSQGLRGDERLMAKKDWERLLQKMNYSILESFYYGEHWGEKYHIALCISKKE